MKYGIAIVVIVLALLGANGIYVIGQGHAAILTRFGHTETPNVGPGLHFKLPFVEHVTEYDARAIVSQFQPEDYKTVDGQPVRVGFFVRWRIADPGQYIRATSGNSLQVIQKITPVLRKALRAQIAQRSLPQLLASQGGKIDTALREAVAAPLRSQLGVAVLAVGIRRVMPPDAALPGLYKRMSAKATAQADAFQAKGEAAAAAIRAKGDRANQKQLAAADQAAATERGRADAAAAKIYAKAASKDPAFFRYWSTLSAWRNSFHGGGAVVVLAKDSPFMQALDSGAAGGTQPKKRTGSR
jgi:membrane protease subunit HflC